MMFCCPECFGDEKLRRIISKSFTEDGECGYCASKSDLLLPPRELYEYFSPVIGIYDVVDDGRDILHWLRHDWEMFENPDLKDSSARSLLVDIIGDADLFSRGFAPSEKFKSDRLERWEELTVELRVKNRYFPNTKMDRPRMEVLFRYLYADPVESTWYRARLNENDAIFTIDQMGAPPKTFAMHGRANPPGISYLYIGSKPQTSISEIRPHVGESLSIAEFEIDPEKLRLVDLTSPKKLVSPFTINELDEIGELRGDLDFLERLGSELTRPVRRRSAPVEYVPSQYLCELIKQSGWDGVLYSSSVSDGVNLALFDPSKARGLRVTTCEVKSVDVKSTDVNFDKINPPRKAGKTKFQNRGRVTRHD